MSVTLGLSPIEISVVLAHGGDFVATLTADDPWPAGTGVELRFSTSPTATPTVWTATVDGAADASTNLATLAATQVLASSGATGTRPVTTSPGPTNWLAWSIALNPAPEPPPVVADPGQFFPFFG